MTSKTPKFDAAIGKLFDSLTPHEKDCNECGKNFRIESGDIELLKKLRVCPPRQCPRCRMRRRMAMMANILQYYRKDCAAHPNEKVISQMNDAILFKVYDNNFWWSSDTWDAISFGKKYNPEISFHDQWKELLLRVPHMAIERFNKNIINSEYTADSYDVKNFYLSSSVGMSENISYGVWVAYGNNCADCLRIDHAQYSYEITDSDHIYKSKCVRLSTNCTNSAFLFDCHNCQNCFGCVNLRNKNYCFFNEQLTKEEYQKRVEDIDLGSRSVFEAYSRKFSELVKEKGIYKALRMKKSPGAVGDYLNDCKNCVDVFCAVSFQFILTLYKSDNVRHASDIFGTNDSMDVTLFGPGESSYNVLEGLYANKVVSSYFVQNCFETEYSYECIDCKYCFGCSGLKKKKFCIFNVQYTEEEYWKTVDEIKARLVDAGTYGEFPPLKDSFFYYHDTYAYAMMPLTKEEAIAAGARWRKDEVHADTKGIPTISHSDIPDNIKDVKDDILGKAILCKKTGRPFRLTPWELGFYREQKISIPVVCPQERLLNRFRNRESSYELYESKCAECRRDIQTTYDPAKGLRVYCEQCYQAKVV